MVFTEYRERRSPLDLEKLRILIVGAGIAGLALGRALRQHGCFADIIERNAEWDDGGTGMYLPGNAIRALRALGLDTQIEKRAALIQAQRFCDCRGRVLNEINLESIWREAGPCIAVQRADLHSSCGNPVMYCQSGRALGWSRSICRQSPRSLVSAPAMNPGMARCGDGIRGRPCAGRVPVRTARHPNNRVRILSPAPPRISWASAMTHRRDRIRHWHPALRDMMLRMFGKHVYRSHYRPLLASP